jgi:hypothetical protein
MPEYRIELRKNKKTADFKLRIYIFTSEDIKDYDGHVYSKDGIFYL